VSIVFIIRLTQASPFAATSGSRVHAIVRHAKKGKVMNTERNNTIKFERKAGQTLKAIAAKHDLSPERIRQICGEANSPSYRVNHLPNADLEPARKEV
jgi:hypothetical protein